MYIGKKNVEAYQNVILAKPSASFTDKYVVYVYKNGPLQGDAELSVGEIREGVEHQQFMQPEAQATAE